MALLLICCIPPLACFLCHRHPLAFVFIYFILFFGGVGSGRNRTVRCRARTTFMMINQAQTSPVALLRQRINQAQSSLMVMVMGTAMGTVMGTIFIMKRKRRKMPIHRPTNYALRWQRQPAKMLHILEPRTILDPRTGLPRLHQCWNRMPA